MATYAFFTLFKLYKWYQIVQNVTHLLGAGNNNIHSDFPEKSTS